MCEFCDTYHRLGYQQCPACLPSEFPPHAAPTPALLVADLLDQLTRYLHQGLPPDPVTLAGWRVLAQRMQHILARDTKTHHQ